MRDDLRLPGVSNVHHAQVSIGTTEVLIGEPEQVRPARDEFGGVSVAEGRSIERKFLHGIGHGRVVKTGHKIIEPGKELGALDVGDIEDD
jgi:hypothetical protein